MKANLPGHFINESTTNKPIVGTVAHYQDKGCERHPSCLNCTEDPCPEDVSIEVKNAERDRQIKKEFEKGTSIDDLATQFNTSTRTIRRSLRLLGMKVPEAKKGRRKKMKALIVDHASGSDVTGDGSRDKPLRTKEETLKRIADAECTLCHNVGWVIDCNPTRAPLNVEIIRCPIPDCTSSGREIKIMSVNELHFNHTTFNALSHELMSIGRKAI